jgi:hypothetical protein
MTETIQDERAAEEIEALYGRHSHCCSSMHHEGLVCTRKIDHPGDHIATDGKIVMRRWPQESF